MWITRLTQYIEYFAVKSRLVYLLTSAYYQMLVKREAKLAKIKSSDRVLCIGGGICPYTAILLHKYTKASVTVIDNNKICVEKSKEFVKRRGLNQIEVVLSDGQDVPLDGYTVIHLAMQISPKEVVVNKLLNNAQEGTRILIRKPKEGVKSLYCSMSQKDHDFSRCIRHGLLSNVDSTSVHVVPQKVCELAS